MHSPQADSPGPAAEPSGSRHRDILALSLVATLAALAGRLALIRDFGTSLPYQDQWKLTAIDVLKPWLDGNLTLGSLFKPINDHVDTVGRVYSLSLTLANGQWNNLLEITVNAVFFAAATGLLVATVVPATNRFLAVILALGAGMVAGLPYGWENTLFGAQSNLAGEIVFSLCYLRAMALRRQCSGAWWLGQLSVGLVLLTQRSGVLVLAPAAGLHLWRLIWPDGTRRADLAGLAMVLVWVVVFFQISPPLEETGGMKAGSWRIILDTILRQLGWPLPHPGWSLLVYLPLAWLILDRLGRRSMSRIEVFLVLVGLWTAAHAAAIGYARGGVTTGFVSRYTDFLVLGFLANAVCLLLLVQSLAGIRTRACWRLLVAAWIGFCAWGLWRESVGGHAGYNLGQRLVINGENLAAMRNYLATGEGRFLARENIRRSLYPHPPDLEALLVDPRFRALLPPETGAAEARPDHGRLGSYLPPVLRLGPGLFAASAALLGVMLLLRPAIKSPRPTAPLPLSNWTSRQTLLLVAGATGLAWSALLAWERPFAFSPQDRWRGLLASAGESVTHPLVFTSTVGRTVNGHELRGAVTTEPAQIRPFLHGTLLDREDYTGIVRSHAFIVKHRFAIVLLTGWPNWPGNAVRWQVENPATADTLWVAALGQPSGPGNAVRLWTESMEPYLGWRARLFLFDGTTGEHGWVGISEPVMTNDPEFGSRWVALLQDERAEATHHVLAALALLTAAGLLTNLTCLTTGNRRFIPSPAITPVT